MEIHKNAVSLIKNYNNESKGRLKKNESLLIGKVLRSF